MIFEEFLARPIELSKERRTTLHEFVHNAEQTGEEVDAAAALTADYLLRCEVSVKKLDATLDKLRTLAQGLALNQPSVPDEVSIPAPQAIVHGASHLPDVGGTSPVEKDCGLIGDLAYAVARDVMSAEPVTSAQQRVLGERVAAMTKTNIEGLSFSWLVLTCVLGKPKPRTEESNPAASVAADVFYEFVRSRRQPVAVLMQILASLEKSVGSLELQRGAEAAFGAVADWRWPNRWLALDFMSKLTAQYLQSQLAASNAQFVKALHESEPQLIRCAQDWIQSTQSTLREALVQPPTRQEVVKELLNFLVDEDISPLTLFHCAGETDVFVPGVVTTCAEFIAGSPVSCSAVSELYSLFLQRLCPLAVQSDHRNWQELVCCGAVLFYSRLVSATVKANLRLSAYAAGFVSVALDNLGETRPIMEKYQPVAEALVTLGDAEPQGYVDYSEEIAHKLAAMSVVCRQLFPRLAERQEPSSPRDAAPSLALKARNASLPLSAVNRSILELAQAEPAAQAAEEAPTATTSTEQSRFSFDSLLRQSRGAGSSSGETVAAMFMGKLTSWGRRP